MVSASGPWGKWPQTRRVARRELGAVVPGHGDSITDEDVRHLGLPLGPPALPPWPALGTTTEWAPEAADAPRGARCGLSRSRVTRQLGRVARAPRGPSAVRAEGT